MLITLGLTELGTFFPIERSVGSVRVGISITVGEARAWGTAGVDVEGRTIDMGLREGAADPDGAWGRARLKADVDAVEATEFRDRTDDVVGAFGKSVPAENPDADRAYGLRALLGKALDAVVA